jgi:hypothetical protein
MIAPMTAVDFYGPGIRSMWDEGKDLKQITKAVSKDLPKKSKDLASTIVLFSLEEYLEKP